MLRSVRYLWVFTFGCVLIVVVCCSLCVAFLLVVMRCVLFVAMRFLFVVASCLCYGVCRLCVRVVVRGSLLVVLSWC